jgi:hypothetical protein
MTARHRVGMLDHTFKHIIDFGLCSWTTYFAFLDSYFARRPCAGSRRDCRNHAQIADR